MTHPAVSLLLACAAGMGLGLFYFGLLWLTVRELPTCGRPALLFMVSFAGRTALALVGFYLVMAWHWERMLACLAGFVAMRQFVFSRLRPEKATTVLADKETV